MARSDKNLYTVVAVIRVSEPTYYSTVHKNSHTVVLATTEAHKVTYYLTVHAIATACTSYDPKFTISLQKSAHHCVAAIPEQNYSFRCQFQEDSQPAPKTGHHCCKAS